MKHSFVALLCAIIAAPSTAHAQSIFDKIDKMVTDVESTISRTENTINRTENTANRLNRTAPQAGGNAKAETNSGVSAQDQHILDEARRIEEQRILQKAESIKQRQSSDNNNARKRRR